MDKRTILAIVLSLAVWAIYMKFFMPDKTPEPVQSQQQTEER